VIPLDNNLERFKTDEKALKEVLADYDLDAELETEFNTINKRFQSLQVVYQTLLKSRIYLNAQND
jgi:hypothetical protein